MTPCQHVKGMTGKDLSYLAKAPVAKNRSMSPYRGDSLVTGINIGLNCDWYIHVTASMDALCGL